MAIQLKLKKNESVERALKRLKKILDKEGIIKTLRDVVPVNYPVKVCGKGRLVLADVNESLERVEGNGLIQLEHATVALPPKTTFAGSVCGGDVK